MFSLTWPDPIPRKTNVMERFVCVPIYTSIHNHHHTHNNQQFPYKSASYYIVIDRLQVGAGAPRTGT